MARRFPSMRGRELLRVLTRQPLAYEVARQSGSHRLLVSRAGYPPVVFSYHDRRELGPSAVREVLVGQVGLSEAEALALL